MHKNANKFNKSNTKNNLPLIEGEEGQACAGLCVRLVKGLPLPQKPQQVIHHQMYNFM